MKNLGMTERGLRVALGGALALWAFHCSSAGMAWSGGSWMSP